MTKTDFVKLFQEKGDFKSATEAKIAIDTFFECVTEVMRNKDSINFIGFGTFSTVEKPEKTGKIPNSDKTYTKAPYTAPKFKAGKSLVEAIN